MNTLRGMPDEMELSGLARRMEQSLRVSPAVDGWIDAGYIHHRAIHTLLESLDLDRRFQEVNPGLHDRPWYAAKGAYTAILLALCKQQNAPTVSGLTRHAALTMNALICSTDRFRGSKFKAGQEGKVDSRWWPHIKTDKEVLLRFNPAYAYASTTKSELKEPALLSHVSLLKAASDNEIVIEPLLLGGPWLKGSSPELEEQLLFHHLDYFEIFPEDVDEFSRIKDCDEPSPDEWMPVMKNFPEKAFKTFLASLFKDSTENDWGGEMSDHFTSRLHVASQRTTAAFLLKGPGRSFSPMTARHLGKHGDQLYRLSCEPAQVLVLQHCHEVTKPVRAQLRSFAVQPSNSRRFLIMDGRDSYRLLKAYGYFDS